MNTKGEKLEEFELLLRRIDKENAFPAILFREFLEDDSTNEIFMSWLISELIRIVKNNKKKKYSFNIDPQQLLYSGTLKKIERLVPYADKLVVEVTEAIPSQRYMDDYYNNSLIEPVKQLHEMGLSVAVDDVSSGMHSFNIVRGYAQYADRIKLSLVHLYSLDVNLLRDTVSLWQSLAKDRNIDIVIEGIDTALVSDWLVNNDLNIQQGFYLGKPKKIE